MKYRIMDVIDSRISVNTIEVRRRGGFFDRIFGMGWLFETSFRYGDDVKVYPYRTREMAIGEAEKWIAERKTGVSPVTSTVIKEI